jgi:hypothetical protein
MRAVMMARVVGIGGAQREEIRSRRRGRMKLASTGVAALLESDLELVKRG